MMNNLTIEVKQFRIILIEDVQRRADEICSRLNDKTIDLEALRLAIIFHDIDYRTYDDHPDASVKVARSFLSKIGLSEQKMHQIQEIMLDHSSPHRKIPWGFKKH